MSKTDLLLDKFIVGVTGGIGSGKSAVTDELIALGVDVVDADIVSRQIVEKGSVVLYQIEQHFGADILLPDGSLNRAKLRQIIFSDTTEKQWLNDLMHPAIRQEIVTQLATAQSHSVILSAPLLIENGLDTFCDRVLVVDAPEEIQLQRASNRDGVSPEQIKSIMASQSQRQARLAKADDVIDNSGTKAELKELVTKYYRNYLNKND